MNHPHIEGGFLVVKKEIKKSLQKRFTYTYMTYII